jgi:hypothetical protein
MKDLLVHLAKISSLQPQQMGVVDCTLIEVVYSEVRKYGKVYSLEVGD